MKKKTILSDIELLNVLLLLLILGLTALSVSLMTINNPLASLITAVSAVIMGFILGLFSGKLAEERWRKLRNALFFSASLTGYSLMLYSFLFTSPFVTWEALFGAIIALQSQLAFIYYSIGEVKGMLSKKRGKQRKK